MSEETTTTVMGQIRYPSSTSSAASDLATGILPTEKKTEAGTEKDAEIISVYNKESGGGVFVYKDKAIKIPENLATDETYHLRLRFPRSFSQDATYDVCLYNISNPTSDISTNSTYQYLGSKTVKAKSLTSGDSASLDYSRSVYVYPSHCVLYSPSATETDEGLLAYIKEENSHGYVSMMKLDSSCSLSEGEEYKNTDWKEISCDTIYQAVRGDAKEFPSCWVAEVKKDSKPDSSIMVQCYEGGHKIIDIESGKALFYKKQEADDAGNSKEKWEVFEDRDGQNIYFSTESLKDNIYYIGDSGLKPENLKEDELEKLLEEKKLEKLSPMTPRFQKGTVELTWLDDLLSSNATTLDNYDTADFVFKPAYEKFNYIVIKMQRTGNDYLLQKEDKDNVTFYGRELSLSVSDVTLEKLVNIAPENTSLTKIGVWGPAGMLMGINGEAIRITSRGYYEQDAVPITSFCVVPQEGLAFNVDYLGTTTKEG